MRINRQGIAYVLSRMDWYWNLAHLLLDENRAKDSSTVLRNEPEKHIIQLYQKLLLLPDEECLPLPAKFRSHWQGYAQD